MHGGRAREVEGIATAGAHRHREFLERRRGESLLPRTQPEVLEFHAAPELAERAEGMDVVFTGQIPAAKLDAELERALRLAHEVRFVEAQQLVEVAQRRQRRFAHSDGADLVGLDQRHRVAFGMQDLRRRRRRTSSRRSRRRR